MALWRTKMKRTTKISAICGLLIFSVVACGTLADSADLAGRYTDELGGFSIRPPKGGYQSKVDDKSCLVRWICNKPDTEEPLWSLSVHISKTEKTLSNIRQAGTYLAAELQKTSAKIDSQTYLTISGQPAVNFSGKLVGHSQVGVGGTKTKLPDTSFRQAWIMLSPGSFMVIKWDSVSLPSVFLDETWANILAGFQLFDPRELLAKKSENAKRAYDLLWNQLTDEKLGLAMPEGPQWFLIKQKGKRVGWMRTEARRVKRKMGTGFEIRTWSLYEIPGSDVRLVRKVMFSDPKLSMEFWNSRKQVGSGDKSQLFIEEGLRQQDLIISTTYENEVKDQQQKTLPEKVKAVLLPKAVGMLLPRLLDLNIYGAYTFAEYDSTKNDFQMRTVEIIGPGEVEIDGRILKAIKATDQPAVNTEPITLWLDQKGNILRSDHPGGIQIQTATEKQVLGFYPKAEVIIREINQASKPTPDDKIIRSNR